MTYMLEGRVLGQSQIKINPVNQPYSLAFFCSTCGKVWGTVLTEGSEDTWDLYMRPCERHQVKLAREDVSHPPGSLAAFIADVNLVGSASWAGTFDAMPREVKLREARLHGLEVESV